jgi:hypothetical protein
VCEVAAGAGVFQELTDDVTGRVDEDPHRDVYMAPDLLSDVTRNVWKLLMQYRADDIGGLG